MKKKFSILVILLFSLITTISAQELNPANRTKAALQLTRKSMITMNSKSEIMGQDMDNSMKTSITYKIDISATTQQGATVEVKTKAIKIETEAMGQEMSFDSEKPEEGSKEISDQAKDMMRNTIKITLDSNGIITSIKGNEKLPAMMNDTKNEFEKGEMIYVFFKLPKAVNLGDTWEEKVDTKDLKTISKVTYKSFENGLASIEKISTVNIVQKLEQMGMIMFSTLEGTVVETIEVDPTTLLIKSRTSISNLKGFVDARGTKIPITNFMTTSETIE